MAALAGVLAGTWLAAAQEPSPLVWQAGVEIARGRGEQGPWRQNESRYDYVDDTCVAIDAAGNVAVAWVDQARKAVLLQRFSADGQPQFKQPTDVSRQPATFSWLPRIAIAADAPQSISVLWQEIIFSGGSHGGDILFARSDDGGRSFSPPINLSNSVGGDGKGRIDASTWHNGSLDLVAGSSDTLFAAWTEYGGPLWFSRSIDGGRRFSRPLQVAGGNTLPARAPSLALGPDGSLFLAWTVGEDPGADIHVARSSDRGETFGKPVIVAPSPSYSDAPKIAVDSAGVVHLVFAESSGGPFDRPRIRYTRSRDGARTFEPARDISGPMNAPGGGAAYPSFALDGHDRLVVVWEQYGDHRQPPRGLGWALSRDGGRTFSPPSLVPGSADAAGGVNGSRQGLLMKKLAVNRAGAVVLVNSSFQAGVRSRVWMLRGQLR